ncbi:proline racemase family protein [Azohydromonas aeria]|uniref:proline racemase family protein n=1 Tax=Azohydromonas aeria TaxID=2590212 RepID=UPI0018DEFE32|nr:proline racemase family protein [Azohydromonas aeria]
MKWDRSIQLALVHCQGEIGKVVLAGAPEIPGATMADKMNHINQVDDGFRRFVTSEPRAGVAMSVNLLVEPTRPDADAGFIVLQADRAHPMSGSNCICVVTALLETGRVPMVEPQTVVRLDTPAGLITATARCEGGRCLSVSLDNVPAFVEALDRIVDTPRWGPIRVDVAFGGVYYAIVDVEQVGLAIDPRHARELAEAGIELKALLARQVSVQHPEVPGIDEIAYVMFRGREADGAVRTCTTLQPGRVDRSPCGTGSSANLAVLHARGEVKVGDARRSRSIIGGEFTAEAIGETTVAGRPAVLPRITGRGWIYGMEELRLDADDPFPAGFALSDTWGPQVGELNGTRE